MKSRKSLTSEQLEWCKQNIPDGVWHVNNEGRVNVDDDLVLEGASFEKFPVPFGRIDGSFDCSNSEKLKSLENAPQIVKHNFNCNFCTSLQSLEGCPKQVGGMLTFIDCTNLVSLKGVPKKLGRGLDIMGCKKIPAWVHELVNDYNDVKIEWEDFLMLHEKFLQKPKLAQAKNLGLF